MRENKLRQLLDADKPTLGTHVHSTWPSVIEAVGHTGLFDYVEFVAEYGPYDLHDLDNICRAAELYDLSSMIKVEQEPKRYVSQRAIGSGFQSVLFTDCHTVAEVRECIKCVRPDTIEDGGYFGAAMRRATYMDYGGGPEYVQALRDIVVAIMIEKKGAVDHLEEILELDGASMIQWGGTDYSMNIGKAGGGRSPEVKVVERHVIETCLKMGVPPRVELNSADDAKYYLDIGVRHFCIGTDLRVFFSWMMEHGEKMRKSLEE